MNARARLVLGFSVVVVLAPACHGGQYEIYLERWDGIAWTQVGGGTTWVAWSDWGLGSSDIYARRAIGP